MKQSICLCKTMWDSLMKDHQKTFLVPRVTSMAGGHKAWPVPRQNTELVWFCLEIDNVTLLQTVYISLSSVYIRVLIWINKEPNFCSSKSPIKFSVEHWVTQYGFILNDRYSNKVDKLKHDWSQIKLGPIQSITSQPHSSSGDIPSDYIPVLIWKALIIYSGEMFRHICYILFEFVVRSFLVSWPNLRP